MMPSALKKEKFLLPFLSLNSFLAYQNGSLVYHHNFLAVRAILCLVRKGNLLHGRILDFPFVGTFENEERAIRWDIPNINNKIFFLFFFSLPFSSLTAMNTYGVSVALHQKYTDHFNPKGTPIFEIAEEMLLKCGDKKSVLDFLKKSESLTTWGLYIGLSNGQALEVDLREKSF